MIEQMLLGQISDSDIQKFLLDLKNKGETAEDITEAAHALLKAAVYFPRPNYLFADLVGTGGDEQGTLNISTAAALLTASLGLPVAKHGNRAVSSQCGAADVLEALGANLNLSPEQSRDCLDKTNFCFLLAPLYHPAMRYVQTARRALKTRTIFNLLGPLVNPARPSVQLTGVYDAKLCWSMAEALHQLGCREALVVHGSGLDEIAIHGPTQAVWLHEGYLEEILLKPIREESLRSILGGDSKSNASWLRRVLQGYGTDAQNQALALNSAALRCLADSQDLKSSLKSYFDETLEKLISGQAYDTLDAFVTYTREQAS